MLNLLLVAVNSRRLGSLVLLTMLAGCQLGAEQKPTAPSVRLLRVFYLVGNEYAWLDVDRPLVIAPAPSGGNARPSGGVRRYEIGGLSPSGVDILQDDDLPSTDAALLNLRREALQSLREAIAGPRRELEWYSAALAGFVGEGLEPGELELIAARVFEPSLTASIVRALYRRAHLLDEKLVAPWRSEDRAAIRLVPLVGGARRGNQRDLAEIFRLALEYQSDLPFFGAAVASVFPPAHNLELYRLEPLQSGPATANFINLLHQNLARASYHSGPVAGWSLTLEP